VAVITATSKQRLPGSQLSANLRFFLTQRRKGANEKRNKMTKSPCIGCEFEHDDKNNATCRECNKRVEYVTLLGGMTHSVPMEVTYGESMIPEESIKNINMEAGVLGKECLIKGCDKEVYCRGLCLNHYQQWYKGYIDHPVLGRYKVAQPKKNSIKKEQAIDKDKNRSKGTEDTKTKLIDLNNYMFAQLKRLSDEDLKGDKLTEEIQRSHAITSVAGQIISNAGLALKARVAVNDLLLKNPPKMLGVEGFDAEE